MTNEMTHNFKPGDLIKDKETNDLGLVMRINPSEVIVAWQDVECFGWDTYPDSVEFICHIPAAKYLDEKIATLTSEYEKRQIERTESLIAAMEEYTKKVEE